MKRCKRVAVLGAGIVGLLAIKALKEEESMEPICFEKASEIGGTWSYRKEPQSRCGSTMSTTTINHSKEMGSISNYPFPDDAPNFMRHDEMYQYLLNMAKHFDLLRHITFKREAIKVERADDYKETGRWKVTVKNVESSEVSSDVYDAVMVCVGAFGSTISPSFPGIDDFQGKIIHTRNLKTCEQFAGQRVVVIGSACSALDAAVDISSVADKVYLSVRTPSWIMPRVGQYGLPFDYLLLRRYLTIIQSILSVRWASKILEYLFLDPKFHHKLYGIDPKYPFLCRDPIVNDIIPAKLISGTVLLRKNIANIEKEGVVFEGDDEETKVDTIIMATGYKIDYSFLEDGIIVKEKPGKFLMYKNVYPVNLPYPTLAVLGLYLPLGAGFPMVEMQSRWATHLLSGKGSLPSREVMMADAEKRYKENANRYSPSDLMSVRVDYVPYLDEIASQFGAKPNFWKMAFTDPRLFLACIFGPSLPYQYRLQGPHPWDGARDAILDAPKRVTTPLCGKRASRTFQAKENCVLHKMLSFTLLTILFLLRNCHIKDYLLILVLPYFLSVGDSARRYLLFFLTIPYFFSSFTCDTSISLLFAFQMFVVTFLF